MTIRETLKRRQLTLNILGLPFAVTALAINAYANNHRLMDLLAFCLIGGYVTFAVVRMRRIPCPRCAAPLGNTALKWGSKTQPAPHCPQCGVSIDEKMLDFPRR
jgi:hypothetical protein